MLQWQATPKRIAAVWSPRFYFCVVKSSDEHHGSCLVTPCSNCGCVDLTATPSQHNISYIISKAGKHTACMLLGGFPVKQWEKDICPAQGCKPNLEVQENEPRTYFWLMGSSGLIFFPISSVRYNEPDL